MGQQRGLPGRIVQRSASPVNQVDQQYRRDDRLQPKLFPPPPRRPCSRRMSLPRRTRPRSHDEVRRRGALQPTLTTSACPPHSVVAPPSPDALELSRRRARPRPEAQYLLSRHKQSATKARTEPAAACSHRWAKPSRDFLRAAARATREAGRSLDVEDAGLRVPADRQLP